MPKAEASHILVRTEDEAIELRDQLELGADFAELARHHSTCPSSQSGGSLGEFNQGEMVPEFDQAVFGEGLPVGEVSEPVKTQFGFHLIKLEKLSD
jgi:peptidyl-prolyl cis-trans isomerase C